MNKILLVGFGGFLGAVLRYLLSGFVQNFSQSIVFPYGTFVVNMIGCFLIGIFSQLMVLQAGISAEMRLFFMVGILGSFTTYSTFSNETMLLIDSREFHLAVVYIAAHVILGLSAVLLGQFSIATLWR